MKVNSRKILFDAIVFMQQYYTNIVIKPAINAIPKPTYMYLLLFKYVCNFLRFVSL